MKQILSIKDIKQDISLQPRAKMDSAIIAEYTESIKAGDKFPPVIVYEVSQEYFLVDGYHRLLALKSAKVSKVEVDVRTGTMRDAVLFSAGVNATHGIRRSNEDKNRAVMILLRDPEWSVWSDNQIAKACNVSDDLVSKIRKSIIPISDRYRTDTPEPTSEKRKVKRAGKTYEMDVSKIRKKEPKSEKMVEPVVLHPNLKKQDPDKCFSPQPGSIPVTDTPPQPSLAEQIKQDDVSPIPDDTTTLQELEKLREIEASIATPRRAPCLCNEPCPSPDGTDHCIRDGKGRRFKCALWGQFITQMVEDLCYFDAKARREAKKAAGGDTGFVRASGLNVPAKSTQTLPTIGKHPLLKSRKERDAATDRFINDCLTDRYHRVIRDAMTDHTELSTPLDVVCKGLDLLSEWDGEE